ncbi:SNF2-related protein [Dactylosporangium cerinum]|uniref:SNF2-related protein n=1 Tax=Dactylosporangium cerinum TaxID=1434730 RepID=A0ABV9W2P3_9ACTN
MNVVHGVITTEGRLACWAETPAGPGSGLQRRPRRAIPHPFATLPPISGAVGTADLALPTVGARPAPSPELSALAPADASRTMLWTVPVVHVAAGVELEPLPVTDLDAPEPETVPIADIDSPAPETVPITDIDSPAPETVPITDINTLTGGLAALAGGTDALTGGPTAGPGRGPVEDVRPGASIGALTDLVTFAADLVRRGRVLPDLLDHPIEARWRPVLWGDDAVTFEALWRAMPGIACAAGDWTAEEAVRAALHFQVDALVRAALGDRTILADGQVRQDGTVRAWLAALTGPDAALRERPNTAPNPTDRPGRNTSQDSRDTRQNSGSGQDGGNTRQDGHDTGQSTDTGQSNSSGQDGGSGSGQDGGGWHGGTAIAPGQRTDEPTGNGGRVVRESTDVRRVRDTIRRWAASGRPAAVRLCFRLSFVEEFDDGEDDGPGPARGGAVRVDDGRDASGWLVEFLLQPVAEPGLLVPAQDVWLDASSPLFRWVDYPQDVLLEDLGRASRLWAELDEALHQARPEHLRLDTIGAYDFLRHAGILHDAGFGVLLPAQWQRRQDLGLTLTTHTAQPASPVLRDTTANRDAIVRYRWGLAIGDEFLSEADLQELARAKVPLVRLRGRWVHLDRERLRAGLAFLARGGQGHMSAGEAMRLVRLIPESDLPLPVTGVDGTGWLADLLTGRAVERLELLDAPASLNATLRPYQRKGLSWLAFLDGLGVGALLADDMGLGKTVQVLALEALLRDQRRRPPTLIVCPLSVLGNWRREIERFTPGLRVAVHHGTERMLRDDVDLVLTTYQVATRDVDRLAARDWDRIVLDEAQHVKNSTSAAARAVREIPARHRVALTGTPVENRLTELWSIADFLNPGILGPASIFRARYSVPVERYADADAAARLRRVTRPFLLRRVKTDRAVIADLPDKLERRQWCNLTLEQATLYKAVVDELFVKLREGRAGDQRKGLVLSAMTKLKQVCNHPAHLMGDGTPLAGRSGKLARLEEILTAALDAGDRALVFTQFAKFGHLLTPYLAARLGTGVEFLHGGTAKGARDAMVQRFQSGEGPGVLLLSLKAGGTGLNLTAANHVVHVDRWWNPATEQQATDRAFRIGQRRDVQVHTFVCVGTIEERVDTVMAEKRTLAGVAVGSGEGWLTGLSTDDLLDLMTLRPEAIDE